MIKTAVCDDEKIYSDAVCGVLGKMKLGADVFSNGEALLSSKEKYDIYILDIEMPGMNGMETAEKIRKNSADAVIIFLTNHDSYVFEGYEVDAFRYILKSRLEEKLPEAVKTAVDKLRSGKRGIVLKMPSGEMRMVPFKDIVMAEKVLKKVVFHLANGEKAEKRMAISEAAEELDGSDLISVRKGVIINAAHIKRFEGMKITMDTDAMCYISRAQLKSVKEKILAAWKM